MKGPKLKVETSTNKNVVQKLARPDIRRGELIVLAILLGNQVQHQKYTKITISIEITPGGIPDATSEEEVAEVHDVHKTK